MGTTLIDKNKRKNKYSNVCIDYSRDEIYNPPPVVTDWKRDVAKEKSYPVAKGETEELLQFHILFNFEQNLACNSVTQNPTAFNIHNDRRIKLSNSSWQTCYFQFSI